MANPFVHVELQTNDPASAKKFYTSLFGWKLQDVPMPNGTYTMIDVGGGTGGGMMRNPVPGAPSHWLSYVAVDDIHASTKKAKELGATHTVDSSKVDPVKAIRELTNGGVEYAFEAIGLKKTAEQAFECIRPGGTATVIGMIPVGQKLELEGSVFLREKRIQGCSMGSNRFKVDMPKYVDFYQRGLLRLDEMITRRGRLEDVNEAFRAMKAGEVARTVLMFE